jgi:hypothetical protein
LSALKQYIETIKIILNIMKEDTKAIIDCLLQHKAETKNIVINQRALNDSIMELVIEVRKKFRDDLMNELIQRKENNKDIPETLKIIIHQGDYLFSGVEERSYGLYFVIEINNELFYYNNSGEGAYGGCGNGIQINNINAHYGDGIDQTNGLLVNAYETAEEWTKIVKSSADKILEEVMKVVREKFDSN